MSIRLSFHGAAGTVTGSCQLLETGRGRLLVDCGLFQGSKTLKELNYGAFPFDPARIDAVLVTHAHIDHAGMLPKLARDGYGGRIMATAETLDLLTYVLPDAGYVQESGVERLNRRRQQRGEAPVTPIYTKADAEALLPRIDGVAFGAWLDVLPGIRARFWPSGHILGSASIEIEAGDGAGAPLRLLFSGDLGPGGLSLQGPAQSPSNLDYVVVESTYGDRDRPHLAPEGRRALLRAEVSKALAKGGNLLIPAFAVERTQDLLFDLGVLFAQGALPETPVFLDSPLAVRATAVFAAHAESLGEAAAAPHPFDRRNFHFIEEVSDSKALNRIHSGAIIIAASGMCDAGRIRHHLKAHLWRREATVLLVGYQAPGTLGRLLRDGAKSVRIEGEELQVAAEIRELEVYSAHADRAELVDWVMRRAPIARAAVLVHGEPGPRQGLADALVPRLPGLPLLLPTLDSVLTLDRAGAPRLDPGRPRLPPQAVASLDWHNRYAALALAINRRLRKLPSEAARETLLRRLERVLDEPPTP
jgi:metallo-beta-lactamase family protein